MGVLPKVDDPRVRLFRDEMEHKCDKCCIVNKTNGFVLADIVSAISEEISFKRNSISEWNGFLSRVQEEWTLWMRLFSVEFLSDTRVSIK